MWNLLPQDLLFDILSWLPVKSLLRCRCVCKRWCNSIRDPSFVKQHLSRVTETDNLILINKGDYLYSIDFDEASCDRVLQINYPSEYRVDFLGSCNGLICFTPCKDKGVICLWNPCTKEYKKLPKLPPVDLSFWHCSSNSIHGFGYDPILDDYKVVRIGYFMCHDLNDLCTDVKIYELGTNSWRTSQQRIPYNHSYDNRSLSVLVNETVHWIVLQYSESDLLKKLIVSFDIGTEEYREVPQPDYVDDECFCMTLGVLGGCLSMIKDVNNLNVDLSVELWVMKNYGVKESWVKLFTIARQTIKFNHHLKTLRFSKNGEILMVKDGGYLVLYDPKCERITNLEICGLTNWFGAVKYVESLVSLKSGTYVEQKRIEGNNIKLNEKWSNKLCFSPSF